MGSSLMSRWSTTGLAAADSPAIDIQSLLESSDPKLMRLAEEARERMRDEARVEVQEAVMRALARSGAEGEVIAGG